MMIPSPVLVSSCRLPRVFLHQSLSSQTTLVLHQHAHEQKPKPGCTRASRRCHNKNNKLLFFHTLQRGTQQRQQQLADIVATRRSASLKQNMMRTLQPSTPRTKSVCKTARNAAEKLHKCALSTRPPVFLVVVIVVPFASFLPGPFPSDSFLLTAFFPLPRTSRSFCPQFCVSEIWAKISNFFGKISRYYNRKTHISPDSFLLTAIFFSLPRTSRFYFSQFCMSEIWAKNFQIFGKISRFYNRETHISPDSILFNRHFHCPEHHLFFSPNFECPKFGRHFPKFWQNQSILQQKTHISPDFFLLTALFFLHLRFFLPIFFVQNIGKISRFYTRDYTHISPDPFLLIPLLLWPFLIRINCQDNLNLNFGRNFPKSWQNQSILHKKKHISPDSFLFNSLLLGPFSYQGFFSPKERYRKIGKIFQKIG